MNSEQSSRSSRTYLEEVEPFVHSRSVTTHQTKEVIVDALTFVVTSYTDIPIILTTNSTLPQIVILNNTTPSQGVFESKLIIPLYVIIFLLAVIGNSLVLITLVQNKRMRTVTNVYLLNLVSFKFYKWLDFSFYVAFNINCGPHFLVNLFPRNASRNIQCYLLRTINLALKIPWKDFSQNWKENSVFKDLSYKNEKLQWVYNLYIIWIHCIFALRHCKFHQEINIHLEKPQ